MWNTGFGENQSTLKTPSTNWHSVRVLIEAQLDPLGSGSLHLFTEMKSHIPEMQMVTGISALESEPLVSILSWLWNVFPQRKARSVN